MPGPRDPGRFAIIDLFFSDGGGRWSGRSIHGGRGWDFVGRLEVRDENFQFEVAPDLALDIRARTRNSMMVVSADGPQMSALSSD